MEMYLEETEANTEVISEVEINTEVKISEGTLEAITEVKKIPLEDTEVILEAEVIEVILEIITEVTSEVILEVILQHTEIIPLTINPIIVQEI